MQFDRLLFRISALTEHLTATHFQAVDVGREVDMGQKAVSAIGPRRKKASLAAVSR